MSMIDDLVERVANQYAAKACVTHKHNITLTLEAANPPTYDNPFGVHSVEDLSFIERYGEIAKKAEYEKAKGRISDMFHRMIKECLET